MEQEVMTISGVKICYGFESFSLLLNKPSAVIFASTFHQLWPLYDKPCNCCFYFREDVRTD